MKPDLMNNAVAGLAGAIMATVVQLVAVYTLFGPLGGVTLA